MEPPLVGDGLFHFTFHVDLSVLERVTISPQEQFDLRCEIGCLVEISMVVFGYRKRM